MEQQAIGSPSLLTPDSTFFTAMRYPKSPAGLPRFLPLESFEDIFLMVWNFAFSVARGF